MRYSTVPEVFNSLLIVIILSSAVSVCVEDFRLGRSADRGRPSVTSEHLKIPDRYKFNIPFLVKYPLLPEILVLF